MKAKLLNIIVHFTITSIVLLIECSRAAASEATSEGGDELSKVRFTPGSAYSSPPARILLATTRYNCHKRPGKTLHVVERKDVPLVYVIEQTSAAPGQAPGHGTQ